MVTAADWPGLRHTLLTYSRWLLLGTIPVTIALIYYSEPVVAFVFQRGAFTEADSHLASQVQAMLLLQVPVYAVGMMFVRLITALKANYLMLWSNGINLVTFVVLAYALMPRFGVVGIALATSIMYLVSVSFLVVIALRLIKGRNSVNVVRA
jgi:putative peptidoglycan lipid II flippase